MVGNKRIRSGTSDSDSETDEELLNENIETIEEEAEKYKNMTLQLQTQLTNIMEQQAVLNQRIAELIEERDRMRSQIAQNNPLDHHQQESQAGEEVEMEEDTPQREEAVQNSSTATLAEVDAGKTKTAEKVRKTETSVTTDKKEEKNRIPPIIIRGNDDWMILSKRLYAKKMGYSKASTLKDGIKVFSSNSTDYRNLIAFLKENNRGYNTYSLQEGILQHGCEGH
ncbi:hypothetical protein WA026_021325 [Henosepilachna vigintioctopunctata]|uniref:Uncharacterized protein n=1 Tax=Henosepilachna vigintioctopunctata TaxID=420089 RepID=A0AAW1UBL7_9CUCU